MECIRGQHNVKAQHRGCVATIGNFDGVHLGHQAIFAQMARTASLLRLPRVAITFEPQPQEFFCHDSTPPARLMRLREKLSALRGLGIERVLCLRFGQQIATIQAAVFVKQLLVGELGIRHMVIGENFRFGHQRTGDFHLLSALGKDFGFTVEEAETCLLRDERISSTRVRTALAAGNMAEAASLLGRPYGMHGRVVYGDQLGRMLGFPTANIFLHRRMTPLHGVYTALVHVAGRKPQPAVANVGHRPTVAGLCARLEVHLLDFHGNLYGQALKVDFLSAIRAEQRFTSLDALRTQIGLDVDTARAFFAKRHL